MKEFDTWWNEKLSKEALKEIQSHANETPNEKVDGLAKRSWRAALECILEMKVSSAPCKTELDVLRDRIKQELDEGL